MEGPVKVTPLEACDMAARYVRGAGFVLVWVSMKSEACYYSFPGRFGCLRVATHRKGGRNADMKSGPTIASITFPEGGVKKDGLLHLSNEYIENHTANAIGLYLIRAKLSGQHP